MRLGLQIFVCFLTFGIGMFFGTAFNQATNSRTALTENKTLTANSTSASTYRFFTMPEPAKPVDDKYDRKKPYCNNQKILPIWHLLQRDKEFIKRVGYSGESADCSDMLEIKYIDLNKDGKPEILVRGNNFQLCSAVGNCGFWIFGRNGRGFRTLLSSADYIDRSKIGEQVLKSRTNGYSNIVLKGHMDAANTDFDYFRFNGLRYVSYKCMVEAYVPGSSEDPKWEFITCKEYDRWQKS